MEGLLDFFTREAGQRRRAWLDEQSRSAGGLLDYYLGPTGIPDKMEAVAGLLNYTDAGDMPAAADASRTMWNNPTVGNAADLAAAAGALTMPLYSARMGEGLADLADEAVRAYDPNRVNAVGDWRFWEDPKLAQPYRKPDATQTKWTFGDVDASLNSQLSKQENRRIDADTSRIEDVPIRKLMAMQDNVGSDFATTSSSSGELPIVVRKGGKMFVRDGHHRLTKASEEGAQTARVRFIDLDAKDTGTPLLDYDATASKWTKDDESLLRSLLGTP